MNEILYDCDYLAATKQLLWEIWSKYYGFWKMWWSYETGDTMQMCNCFCLIMRHDVSHIEVWLWTRVAWCWDLLLHIQTANLTWRTYMLITWKTKILMHIWLKLYDFEIVKAKYDACVVATMWLWNRWTWTAWSWICDFVDDALTKC